MILVNVMNTGFCVIFPKVLYIIIDALSISFQYFTFVCDKLLLLHGKASP